MLNFPILMWKIDFHFIFTSMVESSMFSLHKNLIWNECNLVVKRTIPLECECELNIF